MILPENASPAKRPAPVPGSFHTASRATGPAPVRPRRTDIGESGSSGGEFRDYPHQSQIPMRTPARMLPARDAQRGRT